MKKFTKAINNFVDKMGYLNNKNIEGIIYYGSSQTGFANEFSDIDLHIIFNNKIKEEIRGSMLVDGVRVEYFEKSLSNMYKKALHEFKNQSNSMVSMVEYGTVIFDKNNRIKELQNYVHQLYSLPMPCMDEEKAKEQVAIINNFFDDLKNLIETNNIYANHVYHLTLERIKDLYYSYNGLSGVSRTKALRVMLNEDYRNAIKKDNPSDEFIELYVNCLNEKLTIENKLNNLYILLKYTTKNINLDKYNHRIILTKKNK